MTHGRLCGATTMNDCLCAWRRACRSANEVRWRYWIVRLAHRGIWIVESVSLGLNVMASRPTFREGYQSGRHDIGTQASLLLPDRAQRARSSWLRRCLVRKKDLTRRNVIESRLNMFNMVDKDRDMQPPSNAEAFGACVTAHTALSSMLAYNGASSPCKPHKQVLSR